MDQPMEQTVSMEQAEQLLRNPVADGDGPARRPVRFDGVRMSGQVSRVLFCLRDPP